MARKICKRFGGIHAVDDVSFTVRDRVHALIGPNGAGKTRHSICSASSRPTAARSSLRGTRSLACAEDITAKGVGRSFQITNLFSSLSVEENLRLAVQARHSSRFAFWRGAHDLADVTAETTELIAFLA